jgi:hypothetical protein
VQETVLVVLVKCLFWSQISPTVLKQLVEKIREDIGSVDEDSIKTHFTNTLAHLKVTQDL